MPFMRSSIGSGHHAFQIDPPGFTGGGGKHLLQIVTCDPTRQGDALFDVIEQRIYITSAQLRELRRVIDQTLLPEDEA